MEEALVFIPLLFIALYFFIKRRIDFKVTISVVLLRLFLLVQILLAVALFAIIISHVNDVRIWGFEGNKKIFCIAYFGLLLTIPLIEKSNLSSIEKCLANFLTGIPIFFSALAMIPWLGLFVWSFFIRITGSEREIVFENKNYGIEKMEYIVMSGGHYNYYLIEKMENSRKEKIVKELYRHPDRFKNFDDIFKLENSIYFTRENQQENIDTIPIGR